MPQMAPIMWVPLMFSFSTILFFSIIKISFLSTNPPIKINKIDTHKTLFKQMNWTW